MSEYRFNLTPPPVDTITGKDILEMLNAPTQYGEFKQFAQSGKLCSPNHNPAFRGLGRYDEYGNLIKDMKQNHPRLEIGNYFLMMMADANRHITIPKKRAKLWLCQVYEAVGFSDRAKLLKFKGRGIRYKYYQMGKGATFLDWKTPEGFALFKAKVFDMKRVMHNNNGGNWNDSILHFHIFGDSIDLDFINWPFEKPKGLI
tara:strand:- start:15410 stop:16012 length:603 start_codon:yes stop_codon:yes gene_type:complete